MGLDRSRSFWASVDVWQRTSTTAKARASRMGIRLQTVVGRVDPPALRVKVPREPSGGLVRIDTRQLQRVVDGLLERVRASQVEALDEHVGELAASAFRRWPVSSGLSRAMLQLTYETSNRGLRVVARVTSSAPYTMDIRSQPARKLLDAPASRVADRVGLATVEGASGN